MHYFLADGVINRQDAKGAITRRRINEAAQAIIDRMSNRSHAASQSYLIEAWLKAAI